MKLIFPALYLLLIAGVVCGQGPTFEVASVKPSAPPGATGIRMTGCEGGPGTERPSRINCRYLHLQGLLTRAFDLKPYQVLGPEWLESQAYDIDAIIPPGSTKEQVQFMFRSLLLERFKLVWHRDSREVAAYSLAAYKGAPKLKAHAEVSSREDSVSSGAGGRSKLAQGPDGFPLLPSSAFAEGPVTIVRNGRARLQTVNGTTAQLAGTLSGHLDRLIVDETGLTGRYDSLCTGHRTKSVRWAAVLPIPR